MIYKFRAGSDAWLETRRNFLMATEVAPMFGLNPYTSIAEVFRKKDRPDKLDNKFLRAGRIYEPAVINALKVDLDWDVGYLDGTGESSFVFALPEHRLASTPDAWRWDDPSVVEAKTTSQDSFNRYWRSGEPPLWYICQVQAQMFTANMDKAYLVCLALTPDPPLAVYQVDISPEFCKRMTELAAIFYEKSEKGESLRSNVKDKEFATKELRKSTKLISISEYREAFPGAINIEDLFRGTGDGQIN